MALVLAVNNGAFAALAFIGVNAQSNAIAATTPAVSLDQSTTKFVPPTSTYPAHTYQNGDLNAQNSAYTEGECVPFRAQLTNLDTTATQEQVVIQYEHFRAGNYGYWSIGNFAVDLGSNGTIDAVAITTSALPDPNATTADQTVTVSFAPAGNTSATLYWCGVLAVPANGHGGISSISGAPVHMRVIGGTQTVGGTLTAYTVGNQDRSIQPAAVQPFPALAISKSGPATATLGASFSYTITVSNSGTGPQAGVSVTDTVPTGLTINGTPSSTLGTCSVSGQLVTCTLGTVNAGVTATITITVTPTLAACGTVNNHGTLTPGTIDSNVVSTVVNCPNVSVLKTGNGPLNAGETATFTIVVTAGGTGDSANVSLSDTLPAGTWTLGGANAASCNGGAATATGTLTCTFGTMLNGTTRTVTLSRATTAADCTSITNTATVSATVDSNTSAASNSSTASITVNCGVVHITKDGNGPLTVGANAVFTLVVSNTGVGNATGVTVTDTLPSGTWTVAAPALAGCPATASGTLTCTFTGALLPGAANNVTITLTRATTANDCPSITNPGATVAATNDGSNTAPAATITVNCPNVSVLKTAGQAISAGGTASFTIVVTAGGTGASTQVTLTDDLAAGLTWSTSGTDAGACTITGTLLECDFGTMTNGSSRTVILSATTSSANCPSITNTALVSAAVDTDVENDSSTATQTVNCGQISLTKTADNASVAAGTAIGFVITVTNSGDGTATGATVSDALPTTAGTSWTIDALNSDAGCSITTGTLTCNFGDLASKTSKHVHVTSPTTTASCGTVSNTATVRTGNAGSSEAGASVTVTCPPPPPPPALGGILVTKYNDTNRSGTRDAGEPGLQGFVFTVKVGGTTVATLTSDATGSAASGNLSAGTYTVTETQQAGWTSTDPGTSLTKTVTVNAGQTTAVLFGNAPVQLPPTSAGTLVVTKYNDQNANKTRDTNEPALSGWTFTVKDANGATVGSAATDANGNAIFSNVTFGTYTVTETLQSGWTSTDPGGATPTKTVTINAANTTVLFGNAQIKLPNTSTLEAPPASPSPAMLFLVAVLLGQGLLLTLVFRRWRN